MVTPKIVGFEGPSFDLFDALGLVPRPSYTVHEIQLAWRAAFKILHSDRKHINGKYIPKFPSVDQITRAKDFLSEHPSHIYLAYDVLVATYRSTWNPYAKPGTPAVLQPIPGAVAEALSSLPSNDDYYGSGDEYLYSYETQASQRMPRTATAAQFRGSRANDSCSKGESRGRAARDAESHRAKGTGDASQPYRPSSGERYDNRPWRIRRRERGAKAHAETYVHKSAEKVIDEMLKDAPGFEDFLRAHNVEIR